MKGVLSVNNEWEGMGYSPSPGFIFTPYLTGEFTQIHSCSFVSFIHLSCYCICSTSVILLIFHSLLSPTVTRNRFGLGVSDWGGLIDSRGPQSCIAAL